MKKIPLLLLTLLAALSLSACGGGGGGRDDDEDVTGDVTASNYASLGADMVQVLDAAGVASIAVGTTPARLQATSAATAVRIDQLIYRLARPVSLPLPSEQRLDVYPVTQTCPEGGYITGSVNDADNDGVLSVGDTVAMTYVACVLGGEAVSGALGFTVRSADFSGNTQSTSLDFTFGNLGNDALRYNGAVRVTLTIDVPTTAEQFTMAYRDMGVTIGGRGYRWAFTATFSTQDTGPEVASFSGLLGVAGPTFMLSQPAPFVIGIDGWPESGRLAVTDAGGDRLEVEAGLTRYVFSLFLAGNATGTPDARTDGPPYQEFEPL